MLAGWSKGLRCEARDRFDERRRTLPVRHSEEIERNEAGEVFWPACLTPVGVRGNDILSKAALRWSS